MRKPALIGAIAATLLVGTAGAQAGPWEDGMVAYNRGDYVPAIRLFRPLAEQGNPTAKNQIGVMYRKGEGVARSPARAFMWFSLAAKRGDAKAALRDVSKTSRRTKSRRPSRWRRLARLRTTEAANIDPPSMAPGELYARARMTCAWILAATSPFPCLRAMAAAAWSVAASSFSALLASISLRSGVPWQ